MDRLTRQYVAFIDLLGFRDALKDPSRLTGILELQQLIRSQAGNYEFSPFSDRTGGEIRPAFSAFSDHFLISYPKDEIEAKGITAYIAFYASTIAANALHAHMLIRGGLCEGDLYHHEGIAFGPALVDAYEIESAQAFYPRIVLHEKFASAFGEELPIYSLRDSDGSVCVDYLAFMLLSAGTTQGLHQNPGGERAATFAWIEKCTRLAEEGLALAQQAQNARACQNWRYFVDYLNLTASKVRRIVA